MSDAVVDANVLIAFRSSRDENHHPGTEIVRGIDHGELPTGRVTNYVLAETLSFLHARSGDETDLHRRLERAAGFALDHAVREDFWAAIDVFETYDGLSFGDATIVAYMRRTGVRYLYSFDDDFEAVPDLIRLGSATDPFAP